MGVQLEIGKTYLSRTGARVTIVKCCAGRRTYKWISSNYNSYTDDGRRYDERESISDLVQEVTDDADAATDTTTSDGNEMSGINR